MAKPPSHEQLELDECKTIKVADPEDQKPRDVGAVISERYQVTARLGAGGMSTVYQVKHLLLNKTYALKLLQHVSEKSVQRFQQEAKAATLLEHPNIVRVNDFGIADGQPFMTMECIEGDSLADLLKKSGPLAVDRMARLFGQICSGLAHAHEQGVVHRDLKPSNIIVRNTEAGEQAVIVDFGIAKILDDSSDDTVDKNSLTRTGDVFGTPLYMSPEQGQGHRVDARSDIYSLGCMMYESVTGHPPFQGDSVYQIIHKQITESPPPFPEKLRKTAAGRRLEAIILKALAKDPHDRHKYMVEISSALKGVESGEQGFWNDLKSFSSIISGRLKATERKNALTKLCLQLASVVAISSAIAFVTLPGEICRASANMQNYGRIVDIIHHMFNFREREDVFHTKDLYPLAAELKRRVRHSDEAQLQLLEAFDSSLNEAIQQSVYGTKEIKLTLRGDFSMETFKRMQSLRTKMGKIALYWSDANGKGLELVSHIQDKIVRTEQRLELCSYLLWLTLLAAPISEAFIAILLVNSMLSRKKADEEIKRSISNASHSIH